MPNGRRLRAGGRAAGPIAEFALGLRPQAFGGFNPDPEINAIMRGLGQPQPPAPVVAREEDVLDPIVGQQAAPGAPVPAQFNIVDDLGFAAPRFNQVVGDGAVAPNGWNPVFNNVPVAQPQVAGVQAAVDRAALEIDEIRGLEVEYRQRTVLRDRKVNERRDYNRERDQLFQALNGQPDDPNLNARVNRILQRINTLNGEINEENIRIRNLRMRIDGNAPQPEPGDQVRGDFNQAVRRLQLREGNGGFAGHIEPDDNYEYPRCTERGEATPKFFIAYGSVEEYNLRIRHTYISYKGSPVYVHSIGTSERGIPNEIMVTDIRGKNILINLLRDAGHLDARSYAPGYVGDVGFGSGHQAGYLARTPARVYRQGICNENAHIRGLGGFVVPLGDISIKSFLAALEARLKPQPFTQELLKEVLRDSRKYGHSGAFLSTNFAVGALGHDAGIYYRDHKVATISPDGEIHKNLINRVPSSLRPELHSLNIA